MTNLLALISRNNDNQTIRQSTALTTVYLLELNRKFESFMRDKVEELEGRVAAQQARLSTKTGAADADADWEEALVEAEMAPVDDLPWRSDVGPLDDVAPEPLPEFGVTEEMEATTGDVEVTPEPRLEPETPAAIPDYMTLLIGEPGEAEAEPVTEPDSEPVAEEVLAADDAEVVADGADPTAEPEFALATEVGAADEGEAEADFEDDSPAETPVEDHQPVAEGISTFDLLAQEGVVDTIPWFMNEPEEQPDLADQIGDGTARLIQPTDKTTADLPADPIEENGDEIESWDAKLPVAGQKGQWT